MMQHVEHVSEDAAVERVMALLRDGNLSDALDIAEQLVSQNAQAPRFAFIQALVLLQAGDAARAVDSAERACALASGSWEVHNLLGRALRAAGRPVEAARSFRRSLLIAPQRADLHVCLGLALKDQGLHAEAAASYRDALLVDATSAEARINLGNLPDDAQVSESERRDAERTRVELADRLWQEAEQARQRQDAPGAQHALEKALVLTPDNPKLHRNLGVLALEQQRHVESLPHLRRALDLEPDAIDLSVLLAQTLSTLGQCDEALRPLERWTHLDPASRWLYATLLPVIPRTTREILSWRDRFGNELEGICRDPPKFDDVDHFCRSLAPTSFYLAYHGLDDRPLLELQTRAARAACPDLADPAHVSPRDRRPGEPLRVGFLSRHLFLHSVGRTSSGLIAELSRERFEVHVLALPPARDDELARFMRERADHWHVLPESVAAAREAIRGLRLDVLFFQDIGMEPLSFCLAQSRLAPVQCVSFGHPDTSGSDAVDWYVSCASFEPLGAQGHYTERLHCLPPVGNLAYYYRPSRPARSEARAEFGLHDRQAVYLCPQSLFKFHPEFDALLGEILRGDPNGIVVLVEGLHPTWTARLRERFAATIGDVAERVGFVPRRSGDGFLNLMLAADVMLDTTPFNGYNTSLEAFAMGLPVVTLPHAFQRGLHTAGMYRRMGLEDWIAGDAADYVATALRLGRDREARRDASQRIAERCAVLFEDRAVVQGFECFFDLAWQDCQKASAG